ncbi:MAG: hypothetical protein JW744_04650 [Candidatus Diapherotrites archaeon]|uniref:Uncharacterized protein n=1 Tax=Candidatus Iainarchaeum sp. TaxID=3101447 RepID=A0A938YUF6_9ARCH|nr:hypothetical protein [Candidatus Diapherotrites archaeon]
MIFMPNDFFEEKLLDLARKGAEDKVRILKGLHKKVMPSQFERIRQNDKSVMQELFLPKWISWELLRAWSDNIRPAGRGRTCVLCNEPNEMGITFNEKFICENCFVRIKQLE